MQMTYMDNVKDKLARPLFTANLQRGRPGNYNFGYINESEHTGPVGYGAVDRLTPYWKISLTGYQVGNRASDYKGYGWAGIVDTGT